MFEINEYNRITLTAGDTAAFTCTIVDDDGKVREPQEGDTLYFCIDDTDFEKTAADGYTFLIAGSETLEIDPRVYTYRVILETEDGGTYTVIQDAFLDMLAGRKEEEPEPTPEPTPEPEEPDEP